MDVREKQPSERRLIDASAMRDDWLENGENEYVYDTNAVLDSIDAQPTIDAVEIVRCRDCKYFKTPLCQIEDNHDNWFCADGERKDGDGNG